MKKLFLTSYACIVLPLIKKMLPNNKKNHTVAFIPTAGDPFEDKHFVYRDRDALLDMGFKVIDIDIKLKHHKELADALSKVDIVFVAGGDTFYLMNEVRKSGFDSIIVKMIEKGKIYIGSSAGSVICCPSIEGAKKFDNPELVPDLKDYTGLNVVNKIIIPHTQKEKYSQRIKETTKHMSTLGYEVVKLTDEQMLVVDGENQSVLTIE